MDLDPSAISFNVILGVLLVDILLSGDNAIVIALVCRSLPKRQQNRVMWLGILGAFLARLLLTFVATLAMQLPLIKLVGGLLLLKISVGLIIDNIDAQQPTEDESLDAGESVYAAAKTIIVADIVMSLDNVLALSAVTQNSFQMLVLGLVLSIPILMFGSIYIARLLDMFPVFLWIGAAILGGVAGGLLIDDPLFGGAFSGDSSLSHFVVPVLAAVFVVQISRIILRNRAVLQHVPPPPSLFHIFRGMHQPPVSQPVASDMPVVDRLPDANEVLQAPVHSEVSVPAPMVHRPQKDYRVVAGIGVFVLLVGWAIYALVSVEPPPVPERVAAYRCKEPAFTVHYRASARQIRFAASKGVVDAQLAEDRIVWANYEEATKLLHFKPPLKLLASQPEQLEFFGGDVEHAVCALVGR